MEVTAQEIAERGSTVELFTINYDVLLENPPLLVYMVGYVSPDGMSIGFDWFPTREAADANFEENKAKNDEDWFHVRFDALMKNYPLTEEGKEQITDYLHEWEIESGVIDKLCEADRIKKVMNAKRKEFQSRA